LSAVQTRTACARYDITDATTHDKAGLAADISRNDSSGQYLLVTTLKLAVKLLANSLFPSEISNDPLE